MLLTLPTELINEVSLKLSYDDLCNMRLCNRSLYRIYNRSFWSDKIKHDFSIIHSNASVRTYIALLNGHFYVRGMSMPADYPWSQACMFASYNEDNKHVNLCLDKLNEKEIIVILTMLEQRYWIGTFYARIDRYINEMETIEPYT